MMSHIAFLEIPSYPKLLAVTDGGMVLHPNLEEKKHILENAVQLMCSMGYTLPKVAVMAAVETINPKMQTTVDAARLKLMNQEGDLRNCLVEGPISYDLAINRESARIKGYESPVTGDVDLMLVPDVTAGNLMAKALIYSAHGKMAGVIVGAKVPVVLTSRGSSTEEKFLSLVLAASAV
jgi:phosphate butyryltransferase